MAESKQNSKSLLVLSALSCEAKPLIDYYKLKKVADAPFPMFASSDQSVKVCISGIGATNMAAAVAYFAAQSRNENPSFFNLGIAGHEWLELGEARRVHAVQAITESKAYYPSLAVRSKIDSCSCLSVNSPSGEYHGDALIDMEAAAFFAVATKFASSERVQAIKVVSDNLQNDFSKLSAQSISDLVFGNLNSIVELIDALLLIDVPNVEIDKSQELERLIGSHSQQKLLQAKLETIKVLGLESKLEELDSASLQKIEEIMPMLDSLINQQSPQLG